MANRQPQPPRQPPVICACGTSNEPNNKRCISCKALL